MGISQQATTDEIKKKFHELAKKYHPDSHLSTDQDEEKFKEILTAYKVLSNEEKRLQYDNQLKDEQQQKQQYQKQTYTQSSQYTRRTENMQEQKRKFQYEDRVEDGLLNTMRRAPELWVMSGLLAIITIRWYLNLVEAKRHGQQISFPEDPEFHEERMREERKRRSQIPKIFVHPKECSQIPLEVLDEMEDSGRYALPLECMEKVDQYRIQQGARIEFDIDQLKQLYSLKNKHQRYTEERIPHHQASQNDIELIKQAMIFKEKPLDKNLQFINKDNLQSVIDSNKQEETQQRNQQTKQPEDQSQKIHKNN